MAVVSVKMLSQPRNHLSVQNVSVVSPSFCITKRDNGGRRSPSVGCEKEATILSSCGADGHSDVPFVADAGPGYDSRYRVPARLGMGIITHFPFLYFARVGIVASAAIPLRSGGLTHPNLSCKHSTTEYNHTVRIDSPKAHCVSLGTFPHFSLQSSHLNHCYYHQDLHWGPFPPGSHPSVRNVGRWTNHPHITPTPSYTFTDTDLHITFPGKWPSLGTSLERHPFSGLLHSAGMLLHTS